MTPCKIDALAASRGIAPALQVATRRPHSSCWVPPRRSGDWVYLRWHSGFATRVAQFPMWVWGLAEFDVEP